MKEFYTAAKPRIIYKIFELEKGLKLTGTSVTLQGRDIATLLSDCDSCILLAVTLGLEVDKLIRRTQVSDMGTALAIDTESNNYIEESCNKIQLGLEEEFLAKGLYLTDRFSPGYGDMPLSQVRDICKLLDTEKKIGIWVNESDLMIPTKSITAVIGISNKPQPKRISGCSNCKLYGICEYKKAGIKCQIN